MNLSPHVFQGNLKNGGMMQRVTAMDKKTSQQHRNMVLQGKPF